MKNILMETTAIALNDGIRTVQSFVERHSLNYNQIQYFLGDLLDRAPMLKPNQQQTVQQIVQICVRQCADKIQILADIARRTENKNPKIVQLALTNLQKVIDEQNLTNEELSYLFNLNLKILKHTNKDVRAIAMSNLMKIYQQVQESYDDIQKAFLQGTQPRSRCSRP